MQTIYHQHINSTDCIRVYRVVNCCVFQFIWLFSNAYRKTLLNQAMHNMQKCWAMDKNTTGRCRVTIIFTETKYTTVGQSTSWYYPCSRHSVIQNDTAAVVPPHDFPSLKTFRTSVRLLIPPHTPTSFHSLRMIGNYDEFQCTLQNKSTMAARNLPQAINASTNNTSLKVSSRHASMSRNLIYLSVSPSAY